MSEPDPPVPAVLPAPTAPHPVTAPAPVATGWPTGLLSSVRSWVWLPLLGGFVLLFLAQFSLPRQLTFPPVQILALVAIVLGLRHNRPAVRYPLYLLAAGLLTSMTGDLTAGLLGLSGPAPDWAGALANTAYIVGYLFYGMTAFTIVRTRAPGGDRESTLDGLAVTLALTLLLWRYGQPVPVGAGIFDQITELATLLLQAVVTGLTFRVLLLRSAHLPSAWLIAVSGVFGLGANASLTFLARTGSSEPPPVLDLLWAAAYLAAAAAVLHPSIRPLMQPVRPAHPVQETPGTLSPARLLLLGAALLTVPLVLIDLPAQRDGGDLPVVAVASAAVLLTLAAVVFWRLARLLVDRDRVRRDLDTLVQRQRTAARIGYGALERTPVGALCDRSAEALAGSLGASAAVLRIPEGMPGHGAYLEAAGAAGRLAGRTGELLVMPADTLVARVLAVGGDQPLDVVDLLADGLGDATAWRCPELTSGLAVLLGAPGQPLGVAVVYRAVPRPFDTDERRFVQSVANVLAAAIRGRGVESERARLFDAFLDATERERGRVAADLHDGPIQRLTVLTVELRVARARLERGEGAGSLGKLETALTAEIRNLRQVMTELRPATLDDHGLVAALQEQAEAFHRASGATCAVDAQVAPVLTSDQETVVYRVVQEALANISQHARARSVRLGLRVDDHQAVLTVRDDGVGFDPDATGQLAQDGHLGLVWMRERVELAGGRWSLASRPGAGTSIRVTLPVTDDMDAEDDAAPLTAVLARHAAGTGER